MPTRRSLTASPYPPTACLECLRRHRHRPGRGVDLHAVRWGSVRQLNQLGKEIEQLNARAKRIQAVQALTSEVSRAEIAAREARARAERLGLAFGAAARPTRRLRQQLESARREADRLSDSLDKQRRDLDDHRDPCRARGGASASTGASASSPHGSSRA